VARNPYDAHLCAQDPAAFLAGFDFAAWWVDHLAHPGEADAIHHAIMCSDGGADWPIAGRIPHTPRGEGFALGVYGVVADRRWLAATRPPA
jgi:hypothetical protein